MIVDEVTLKIKAGDGGNGAVTFRREKYIPYGGPDGGNGGAGADVYFLGTTDLTALNRFRFAKEIKAENGGRGERKKRAGADGKDLIVRVPVGTLVQDMATNQQFEVEEADKQYFVAKGGAGGIGNFELRSASNQAPKEALPGQPGEEKTVQLTLRFIADIGLIGLPNAGKSSLLNALTNAKAQIGDYPFTTIEANLGNMNGKIIADIPGLIEGAHKGRGLGIKFLKHIEKTNLLLHCIDSTSDDVKNDYKTVREELEKYNPKLLEKKEVIILTKHDLLDEKSLEKIRKVLKKVNPSVLTVSIIDDESLKDLFLLH